MKDPKDIQAFDEWIKSELNSSEMTPPDGVWQNVSQASQAGAGASGTASGVQSVWHSISGVFSGWSAALVAGLVATTAIVAYVVWPTSNTNPPVQATIDAAERENNPDIESQEQPNIYTEDTLVFDESTQLQREEGSGIESEQGEEGEFVSGNSGETISGQNEISQNNRPQSGDQIDRNVGNIPIPENNTSLLKYEVLRKGCKGEIVELHFNKNRPKQKITIDYGDGSPRVHLSPETEVLRYTYKEMGAYTLNISYGNYAESQPINFSGELNKIYVHEGENGFYTFNVHTENPYNFIWDFGDGSERVMGKPTVNHYYTSSENTAQVKVIYFNELCKDSVVEQLSLTPATDRNELFIPNVFTPNTTPQIEFNDRFEIKIENETYYYLVVRDKYRNIVFQSDNKEKLWDGMQMNSDKPCPPGKYYYEFVYSFKGGEKEIKRGFVTIIRE